MSFKLSKLTVENFVVFIDRTTIDFSDSLVNNIEGLYKTNMLQSNGAGKSLIIDAISLALFGKGVRSNYITDYISVSNPNGGIYIGLELLDSSGTSLKIERWRRPDSESNKAKLWRSGVCISQDSTVTKIDEMLQSYIGVNHSNFMSCIFSVMIPGFLKLRPAQRFEVLEQALAVKKIDSVIKKINTAIRIDDEKLSATSVALSEATNKYISESTKKEIYSSNSDSIRDNIKNQEAELSSFMEEERKKLDSYNEYKTFASDCIDKLSPLKLEFDSLSADIRSLQVTKSNVELRLKAVMKSFKKRSTGLECSVCNSSLTEESKESVRSHYEKEIDILSCSIHDKELLLDSVEIKISKIEQAKVKADNALSSLAKQINYVQTNLLALEKGLSSSKEALVLSSSAYNEETILRLAKEVENLKIVKGTLEKNIKISTAWKQAMSKNGLRLAYIKEEVSTLSALASKYASAVYEKPISIRFFINDEKDNPTLEFHVNGKNASLFSTGEGRRLEIAMTLSLMSLLKTSGLSLGFLILDEALDGLSIASKMAVLKVIDSLSAEYQVLMISHDPLIKNRPGHIIQVIKDDSTNKSTVTTHTQK